MKEPSSVRMVVTVTGLGAFSHFRWNEKELNCRIFKIFFRTALISTYFMGIQIHKDQTGNSRGWAPVLDPHLGIRINWRLQSGVNNQWQVKLRYFGFTKLEQILYGHGFKTPPIPTRYVIFPTTPLTRVSSTWRFMQVALWYITRTFLIKVQTGLKEANLVSLLIANKW